MATGVQHYRWCMSLRARGNMSLRQTRLDTLRWLTVTQHTRSNSDVTFLWQIEGVLNICLQIFKSWLYRRDDPTSNLLKIWVTSRHSGEIEPIFVCLFVYLFVYLFIYLFICLFILFIYLFCFSLLRICVPRISWKRWREMSHISDTFLT